MKKLPTILLLFFSVLLFAEQDGLIPQRQIRGLESQLDSLLLIDNKTQANLDSINAFRLLIDANTAKISYPGDQDLSGYLEKTDFIDSLRANLLTELDSTGFSITESQISDLTNWSDSLMVLYITIMTEAQELILDSMYINASGYVVVSFGSGTYKDSILWIETDPIYTASQSANITSSGSNEVITTDERTKLNGIEALAEVNVQADYSETNTALDSYILNRDKILNEDDTIRDGVVATNYKVDSVTNVLTENINAKFDSTTVKELIPDAIWNVENDTTKAINGIVRIDTLVAGDGVDYLPTNVVFSLYTKFYDGTTVSSISAYGYCFSETGRYQYKTILDVSDYKIVRSMDFGESFSDTLVTVLGYTANKHKLECSKDGSVIAYTDYTESVNRLVVSRDFGLSFTSNPTTDNVSSISDLEISDDGIMIVLALNSKIYRYRNELTLAYSEYTNDLAIKNDSIIFYRSASNVYKLSASDDRVLIYTNLNGSSYGAVYNNEDALYVCDVYEILKSTDNGSTFSSVYTFANTDILLYNLKVSYDEQYYYIVQNIFGEGLSLWRSSDSAFSFDSISTSNIDLHINTGQSTPSFSAEFEDGFLYVKKGGIRMPSDYIAENAKDVVTKDYLEGASGAGDITAVKTETGTGLKGGTTTGEANLSLDYKNIYDEMNSPKSADRFTLWDASLDQLSFIYYSDMLTLFGGSGTGIALTDIYATSPLSWNNSTGYMSVASGYEIPTDADMTKLDGLSNFSGGTLTSKLTLNTSTTSNASMNIPTGVQPTSPIEGDMYKTLSGVYTYLNGVWVNLYSTAGSYTLPAATDAVLGGFSPSTTGGTQMSGDYLLVNSNRLTDVTTLSTSDKIGVYSTSETAQRRTTVEDILALGSSSLTVKESDGSPSVGSVSTIEFDGATVSDQTGGTVRVTVTGSGGTGSSSDREILFNDDGDVDGTARMHVLTTGALSLSSTVRSTTYFNSPYSGIVYEGLGDDMSRWEGVRSIEITTNPSSASYYIEDGGAMVSNSVVSGTLDVVYYNVTDNKTIHQKLWVKAQNDGGTTSETSTEIYRYGDTGTEYDEYNIGINISSNTIVIDGKSMNDDLDEIHIVVKYNLSFIKY